MAPADPTGGVVNGRAIVVVADRDASIRDLLRAILGTELGAHVVAEESGEALLVALEEVRPRLIVLEVAGTRPADAGVVRRIKADSATRRVPLLCLTESAPGWGCPEVRALGADACLEKPFNIDEMLAVARGLIMEGRP